MIKERIGFILYLQKLLDVLVIGSSFILSYYINRHIDSAVGRPPLAPLVSHLWLLLIIVPLWRLLFFYNNAYESHRGKALKVVVWEVIKVNLEGLLCLGLIFFIFRLQYVSRFIILIFIGIDILLLILEKVSVLIILRYLREKGRNVKFVLIVGICDRARYFIQNINAHLESGFKIIGCLDDDPAKLGQRIEGVKVIGTSDHLSEILHSRVVDEVFFALPLNENSLDQIKVYLDICHELGIKGQIIMDLNNYHKMFNGKIAVDEIVGTPLISFPAKSVKLPHLYLKSAIDFVLSLATIIVFSPLMGIIALAIKLTSPGPVIFRQKRIGLNGRRFILYKFRTMVAGAEKQLDKLRDLNEMSGPVFKTSNDPRITSLGKFLRKSSLDELPQLFNILKGDMSLVGPRPLPDYEAVHINGPGRRRLSMRPGITCTWQISGRNNIDFEQWMKLDLDYIDNWSLRLDIKTLLKTIPAVLAGKGAR